MNHRQGSITLWIIGLVVVVAVGVAVFVVTKTANGPVDNELVTGEKIYRNDTYGFEFKYPQEWNIVATTTSYKPYWVSTKQQPEVNYSLFKAENIDLGVDSAEFLIHLYVFTRQNSESVAIGYTGGGEDVLSYGFAGDHFTHWYMSRSEYYTWESIEFDPVVQYVIDTFDGLKVIKTVSPRGRSMYSDEYFTIAPSNIAKKYSDTYFTTNSDKNLALLFVFEYSISDFKLWAKQMSENDERLVKSRMSEGAWVVEDSQDIVENERVVETRNVLEDVIKSLAFYEKLEDVVKSPTLTPTPISRIYSPSEVYENIEFLNGKTITIEGIVEMWPYRQPPEANPKVRTGVLSFIAQINKDKYGYDKVEMPLIKRSEDDKYWQDWKVTCDLNECDSKINAKYRMTVTVIKVLEKASMFASSEPDRYRAKLIVHDSRLITE